jgi:hypothetical protein
VGPSIDATLDIALAPPEVPVNRRTAAALLMLPAFVLPLSACGDSATDQAVEQAIEEANPSLDADVSDGGAGVKATDDAGNEVGVGTSAEVPDGFPSAVPLPEGDLTVSAKSPEGGFTLQYQVSGSPAEAADAYAQALTEAGFTVDRTASANEAGGFTATGKGYDLTVLALGIGERTGLSLNVTPEG